MFKIFENPIRIMRFYLKSVNKIERTGARERDGRRPPAGALKFGTPQAFLAPLKRGVPHKTYV